MYTFVNKIAVTGPVTLRHAFIEELQRLGYKISVQSCQPDMSDNYANLKLFVNDQEYDGPGTYGTWRTIGKGDERDEQFTPFTLPQDWNKALKAAGEKGEVEAPVKALGYISIFNKDRETVSFGCQTFTREQVRYIRRFLDSGGLTVQFLDDVLKGFEKH